MTGLGIVLALVLMALAAPLIADPALATLQVLKDRLQPASAAIGLVLMNSAVTSSLGSYSARALLLRSSAWFR
jgi:hypothetical protein